MQVAKIILKRMFTSVFVVVGFSILIFIFIRAIPGDPARMALGENAPQWQIEKLRDELHLNDPIYLQYWHWFKGVIKCDFGVSQITHQPVLEDIKQFLPASIELALYTAFFMMFFAIIFGVASGWQCNTWIDNVFRMISYFGIVTPPFVWAIFFVLIFGYYYNILPTLGRLSTGIISPRHITGLYTIDALLTFNFKVLFDTLKHVILPAFSLMMAPMAQITRIIRSSLVENLQKDYIYAVRSYGIPERVVMFKYLLKPSLIPGISVSGLNIANIIGNAFLIELIFNWPGLSRYGMNAMLKKDLNAIIAVTIIYALLFIILNIVVDIAISILDPRIEIQLQRGQ